MIVSTVVPRARHNFEVLGEKYFGLTPLFADHINEVLASRPGDRHHVSAVDITDRDQATVSSVRFARTILETYGITFCREGAAGSPRGLLCTHDLVIRPDADHRASRSLSFMRFLFLLEQPKTVR